MSEKESTYKDFLKPEIISTIENFELKAKLLVDGFLIGLHKSPYHGFSAEFNEHRPYFEGDSTKNVDWKLFGKTEKLFIKKFDDETNLISKVIVDVSKSMDYLKDGKISKFDYSRLLASALSYLMIKQNDSVGLSLFSENVILDTQPKSTRLNLHKILAEIENSKVDSSTKIAKSLNTHSEKIKKRSLVIIISDFFDDLDEILQSLKRFKYNKNEVILFQILDRSEIEFNFSEDSMFLDLETSEELNVHPQLLKSAYKEKFEEFQHKLKSETANFKIDYHLITTDQSFDKALYLYFSKRKKLG